MLIVFSSLQLGGIETFFVRLIKERAKKGLETTLILFNKSNSDPELLKKAEEDSNVYDIRELIYLPFKWYNIVLPILPLVMMGLPIVSKQKVKKILTKVSHIHVTKPIHAHFVFRLLKRLGFKKKITHGFYYSEIFDNYNECPPYYLSKSYDLVLNELDNKNLVLFSDKMPEVYEKRYNIKLEGCSVFPLGVVSKSEIGNPKNIPNTKINKYGDDTDLRICSIGRLVDFKTYNFWMLDVVKKLNECGFQVNYDIYGDGEKRSKIEGLIKKRNIKNVSLKGTIPYSKFDKTVKKYDLFVGSGTAIIEAASHGIPCIIGIERIREPISYGFFSNIEGFSYNEKGLYPTVEVVKLIKRLMKMGKKERMNLKMQHIEKAKMFTMEKCSENFQKLAKKASRVNTCSINYSQTRFIWSYLNEKIKNKFRSFINY